VRVLDALLDPGDRKRCRKRLVQADTVSEEVSGPRPTWSIPITSTQYATCSTTDSSECCGCFAVSVVCGAASMPMTPPFAAQALRTSSGFMRFMLQSRARRRG
jgi:hypothetical protein